MSRRFGGIKLVEYSADGSSWTSITAPYTSDSTVEPSVITSESTQSLVYGGSQLAMNIGVFDFSEYATLHTAMLAGTKYFWRVTFVDDLTETSAEAHDFRLQKQLQADKRQGLNAYRIMVDFATDGESLTSA